MKDITLYFLFSSLEFLAILLLTFSVFRVKNLENKLWGFLITILFLDISSYFLVIYNVHMKMPIIIIQLPFIILSFIYLFKLPKLFSVMICISGSLLYVVIQSVFVLLALHFNVVELDELQSAFAIKSYICIAAMASIAIIIAFYIRYFNGGFGYSFQRKGKYGFFIVSNIILVTCFGLSFAAFSLSNTFSLFMVMFVAISLIGIATIILSKIRDNIEFGWFYDNLFY